MLCGEKRPRRHRWRNVRGSHGECGEAREGEATVFTGQPPLTCGGLAGADAIVIDESDSAAGQVLLHGGFGADDESVSTVYLVDLSHRRVHSATKSPS